MENYKEEEERRAGLRSGNVWVSRLLQYNMYLWILQYKTSTGLSFSKDKPMPSMEQNTWNVDGRTTLSEDKAEGCRNICEKEGGGGGGGDNLSSNSNSQYYS